MTVKRKYRIKFSLEMKDGAEVRNIDEFRENFDLEKVIGYFHDGKLIEWLEDRFFEDEAEEIKKLSENDPDFGKKLCDILGTDYTEVEDIETIKWRKDRLEKLRQYTADAKILESVDWVAFDQEDLESIVGDEDMPSTVYLCQNTYSFPSGIYSKKNIHWVGIGKNVKVIVKNRKPVDFKADGIDFENIDVEEEYKGNPPCSVSDMDVSDKNRLWYKRKNFMEEFIFKLLKDVKMQQYATGGTCYCCFSYDASIAKGIKLSHITVNDFVESDESFICTLGWYSLLSYRDIALTNYAIYFSEHSTERIAYDEIRRVSNNGQRLLIRYEREYEFFLDMGADCACMIVTFLKVMSGGRMLLSRAEKYMLCDIHCKSLDGMSVEEMINR